MKNGNSRIRKALMEDVEGIHKLINAYAVKGDMLQRSVHYVAERIRDYHVINGNGKVIAVCGIRVSWGKLAEIVSLAVVEKATGKGHGKKLVAACLEEARVLGITEVFALTKVPDFFLRMGFENMEMDDLPRKVWTECVECPKFPDCDEHAVRVRLD